ncbi:hypothetical protein NE237_008485 [Protea cynaroides]|uniref:KIB1-4 beta-propeller domain-containing protein n=1 Tax=Protea cynaroides TaxID=273540 RepID=A0A9Q0KVV8_9MAGN|nr:hypothetical protein NE237_008485 [Protea cynaroides]
MALVNWSELPKDLLGPVRRRLPMVDSIHFGAVCNSWYSVVPEKSYPPLPQLPWLMLPVKVGLEGTETRKFFNLQDKKVYQIKLPKEIRHSRCVGSSFGWLVILDGFCRVLLMNPFSGAVIHLPPTETFPSVLAVIRSESSGQIDHYKIRRHGPDRECSISPGRLRVTLVSKAIVTADPLVDNNYMVVAAGFSGLVFCKAGSDSWTQLDRTRTSIKYCEDILYFNGLLLVLDAHGSIEAWDVHDLFHRKPTEAAPPLKGFSVELPQPNGNWFIKKRYLVESSGDLLQVLLWFRDRQGSGPNPYISASCSVCRFDPSRKTWFEITSLYDRLLFLGSSCAISLSVHDFPECKTNSIYFAEYFWKGWLEDDPNVAHLNLVAFNLEEKRFFKYSSFALQRIRPPLAWVVPNYM